MLAARGVPSSPVTMAWNMSGKVRDEPPRCAAGLEWLMRSGLVASFGHAFRGVVQATVRERNMKVHVVAGLAVGIAGGDLALPTGARLALLLCVTLVISAEALNSALESLVDLHTKELRDEARHVKDAAAAAVLVLSIGSLLVAAVVLAESWDEVAVSVSRVRADAASGAVLLLVTAGLLVRARRPAIVDALGTVAGFVLLLVLAARSLSLPLTAMAAGLFALAAASAWSARQQRDEAAVAGDEARGPTPIERAHAGGAIAAKGTRRER